MKKTISLIFFLLIINSLITLFHLTSVQEFSIFYLNQVDKKSEYHQYNSDKTEITKLGFYKNENTQKITIRPIPYFVKKVPETLPAEIQSLYLAFAHRYERHGEVTGFEKWDTKNIEDMSYAFFENHTVDSDISFWNTDKVTNMKSMFKNAVKFNNNGKSLKNWNTNLVTSMESMFEGAEKFNQNLRSWKVEKVKDNKNFSRGSGFSNDPNKRPDWKTPEVNDPVEKKPKEIQPKEIIHSPLVKPK
ncbi:BspA family leucine-rich repeat surface protein, partial [Mycoplasma capricolum]